jgi:hypothetical protein
MNFFYRITLVQILIISSVLTSVIFWPEGFNIKSILLASFITIFTLAIADKDLSRVFLITFLTSVFSAFVIYALTYPVGIFETADQNPLLGGTDSQFMLHEARLFLKDFDIAHLKSTWGSIIPISYGVFAISSFGSSYIGVVYFNALLYSISIILCARVVNLSSNKSALLPLFGLMPLQMAYNGMLAKEPIYLFIVSLALYLISKISRRTNVLSFKLISIFFVVGICFIFRPGGAIILGLIIMSEVYKQVSFRKFTLFISFFAAILALLIAIYVSYAFQIPLFFLKTPEGGGGFENMQALQHSFMAQKGISEEFRQLFSFPWNFLLSPILFVAWIFMPLPIMDGFFNSADFLFNGGFILGNFLTLVKYFDAFLMLGVLLRLFFKFKILFKSPANLISTFFVFQTLAIVIFNFFESSRHRYLPGIFLIFTLLALKNNISTKKKNF